MKSYLLDTGLLVGLVRSAPWALTAGEKHKLRDRDVVAATSVVCRGELLALAEKFGWGSTKRDQMDSVLDKLPIVDINHQSILQAYARIDAWTHGKAVTSPKAASPPRPAKPMGQNDLWVAATAHTTGYTLLSTDNDFQHLHRRWLDFVYVRQGER